jgi:Lsr2
MAQKITVALEYDLDGGPADQTVRFGLDGAEYEIDLSTRNATAFREQLAPARHCR